MSEPVPSVLFVCLGNICRSPMAESLLRHKLDALGIAARVESAGTGDWHLGEWPDRRTRATLRRHGIERWSRARQVQASDFARFDHVVAMDGPNVRDLRRWHGADEERIALAMDFSAGEEGEPVPDPYSGTEEDFEAVYAMLDRATDGILREVYGAEIR